MYFSVRAISAPPSLPPQMILIPSAPIFIAEAIDFFMARRYDTRPSSWRAMESAVSWAESSGRFTSTILMVMSFLVKSASSSFSLSTSAPLRPMTMPGREVWMFTVTFLG